MDNGFMHKYSPEELPDDFNKEVYTYAYTKNIDSKEYNVSIYANNYELDEAYNIEILLRTVK